MTQIVYQQITDIRPYHNNPHVNSATVPAVVESIKQFGFRVPVIIKADGEIVCGHARYEAALILDMEQIPCIIIDDLTDEQVRAFRLVDNKTAELSTWDEELLLEELRGIADLDMGAFGFDFNPMEFAEIQDDEFELPELPAEPKAKPGQIYQLGRHRLMCGDSTKQDDVQKLMSGSVANLLITDPPYNVDYEGTAGKIENDHMENAAFQAFLNAAFSNANESMLPGAAFYIWHADSEGLNFRQSVLKTGWQVRQCLIWVKNTFVLGRQDYQWQHEPCLYGWKDGAAHYYIDDRTMTTIFDYAADLDKMSKAELLTLIKSISTTAIRESKPLRSEEHPTMKPLPLIGRIMKNSARKGDKVMDLFGGSGTTLIAAEQLGCVCFMMEYDPRFIDVIITRWEKMTGKTAVLITA